MPGSSPKSTWISLSKPTKATTRAHTLATRRAFRPARSSCSSQVETPANDEAHRRDGVHRHRTGQDVLERPGIERPANEDRAADEDGQDASSPRENLEEGNKTRDGVVFQPGSPRSFVSLIDDPALPWQALPTQSAEIVTRRL